MKRKLSVAVAHDADADLEPEEELNEDQPSKKRQHTRRSLFVRSLPSDCTTEVLVNHFSEEFPIKHGTVITDPKTKTCRGYGFVTFADAEDAQRALEKLQGTKIGSNTIKLSLAEPRNRNEDPTATSGQAAKSKNESKKDIPQQSSKLIVRNLPWTIKSSEQLAVLFRSYGKIKFATVPKKKAGPQYGFGIVLLRGRKNAEKALQGLNGKVVDGRTLAVDWAVDKDTWQQQQDADAEEIVEDEEEELARAGQDDEDAASSAVSEESSVVSGDKDSTDDDDGSEQSESELDDKEAVSAQDPKPQEDYSFVLFIRNLPFEATDESLHDHFAKFGRLKYARVVYDRETERSKGTAFVCFKLSEDATKCLKNAPKEKIQLDSKTTGAAAATPMAKSLLQNEDNDPTGAYTMDGRVLQVSKAVDRQQAEKLTEANRERRADQDKDKRRMFLLAEGVVPRSSALYQTLSPSEIAMRDASMKQRKSILQSNPSLHLSLTRLSVRNVPRSISSKDLKQLARQALVRFAEDVKDGKRARLSKEELERGGEDMAEAELLRKKKGVGVVKQAKIVFESREGSKVTEKSGGGRSRGYGFIEYYTHRSALMGLRSLNGHAVEYTAEDNDKSSKKDPEIGKKKRLIVEFALENAQVVHRRKDKEVRARESGDPKKDVKSLGKENKDESAAGKRTEEQEKHAKRQRIINKKRALRRHRKSAKA